MNKIWLVFILLSCSKEREIVDYYPNGAIKNHGIEVNGIKEGPWVHYRDYNQDTSQVEYFKNGVRYQLDIYAYESINDSTSTSSTILVQRTQYADTLKDGEELNFNINGQVSSRGNFVKGMAHGVGFSYYDNGDVKVKIVHNKDTIVSFEQFFPNGQLFIKAENPKNGISVFHDTLGNQVLKVYYKNWQPLDTLDM